MPGADNRRMWEQVSDWWPGAAQSQFRRVGGIDWHYQLQGEGPALVLIHGAAASSHSWAGVSPLLAETFRVLSVDLPGHGFSTAPYRYDPGTTAALLGQLLADLEIDDFIPIGHSAGAVIAAALALHGGPAVSRLITINGALFPLPGFAGIAFRRLARILTGMPTLQSLLAGRFREQVAVEKMIRQMGSSPDPSSARCYRWLLSTPSHVASVIRQMAAWDLDRLMTDYLKIRIPTLVLGAEQDVVVPVVQSRRFASLVPGAEYRCLSTYGHLFHEEAPADAAELVRDWVTPGSMC